MKEATGGPKLYRSDRDLRKDRKFKGMQLTTWFKARRGGRKENERKDSPWSMEEGELTRERKEDKKDPEWQKKKERKQGRTGKIEEAEGETEEDKRKEDC